MSEPCSLIGILDDGWVGLTDAARARLMGAGCVIGARRTLDLVERYLAPEIERLTMDGALDRVPGWVRQAQADGRRVAVLATGDPLCHGIAGRLLAALGADSVEILPTLSTVQLAFARLKRPWQDVHLASCHGISADDWTFDATPAHPLYRVLRAVSQNPLVAVFTSPANGPDRIARALLNLGYGDEVRLSVAARLACSDEAIFPDLTLTEAASQGFPDPNLVIVERRAESDQEPLFGLADDGFAQQRGADGDRAGLITKLEARAVTLAKLGLRADSVVWDIGAGSGAVGLEASRIAQRGHVWAIEKDARRAGDARANARRLRASNYSLFEGRAPEGLTDWPDPDAVFIGGSGGALVELIECVQARLRPGGRLVLNLVTLENLATATAALDRVGLRWELVQLGVARSQPILGLHRLAAANPVWILTATMDPDPVRAADPTHGVGSAARTGRLIGVSLGPGDPELITRRSWAALQSGARWVYPVKGRGAASYALEIARRAGLVVPADAEALHFPMTSDPATLALAWTRAGLRCAELLAEGRDLLFLVEGDASTYSTFGHLARAVRGLDADIGIEVIPGVASFHAAAARIAQPLAEEGETFAVIPAAYGIAAIDRLLDEVDTLVLLKVKPLLDPLLDLLERRGLLEHACFIEKVGTPDERIVREVGCLRGEAVAYLSLLLVRRPPRPA